MPTVDQLIRARTREVSGIPYGVVEKDYAISYLLAGIACTDRLSEALILKGGTALSKFYFENYRFSEDLDFSLRHTPQGLEVGDAMAQTLRAMEMLLQERGPFRAQGERSTLREPHPDGQAAFVVRVQFPAHREALCRLKVEITADEQVLLPPERRSLRHRFPEAVEAMPWWLKSASTGMLRSSLRWTFLPQCYWRRPEPSGSTSCAPSCPIAQSWNTFWRICYRGWRASGLKYDRAGYTIRFESTRYALGREVVGSAIEAPAGAVGRFAAGDQPFGLGGQGVRVHLDLLSDCDVIEVSTLNPPASAR